MTTYYGTNMTNFVATPPALVNARLHGGVVKNTIDAFEMTASATTDVWIIDKLGVDAVVRKVVLASDALGAGAVNVGTYRKNADGTFTAVDADCFASAVDLSSAVAPTDVTYEAAAANISKAMYPLWQRSGLSARPAYGELYIGLAPSTATSDAGTVMVSVDFTE